MPADVHAGEHGDVGVQRQCGSRSVRNVPGLFRTGERVSFRPHVLGPGGRLHRGPDEGRASGNHAADGDGPA